MEISHTGLGRRARLRARRERRRWGVLGVVLALGAALMVSIATADAAPTCTTDCYVSPTGSDAATGQSGDPLLTLQTALSQVSSGGTVHVADGTYSVSATTTIPVSVTVEGESRAGTVINGPRPGAVPAGNIAGLQVVNNLSNVTIRNLTVQHFDYGIFTNGNLLNGLHLQDLNANDNRLHGIWIQANVGSGINDLDIDNVEASRNNQAGGLSGRGLWVINGPKTNVSVTDSTFSDNGLVGLDISDGTVNGLVISGNTVTGNGDSGIGAIGASNADITDNTVTNNGRFGIEVKNTVGNGLATGAGHVLVEGNAVSRTIAATDARDYAGILVMRRGPAFGAPDQPAGVVIDGNQVTGYHRKPVGSTGDGFGVVVGGVNHTITKNSVSSNDVGVQIQGGNTPDVQSTPFFDRDSSTSGSAAVTRNSIVSNSVQYRTAGTGSATDLTCNWWGADASPGYAGSAPWLTTADLDGACDGGTPPVISIGNASVKEGNSGSAVANVPVTLNHTYPSAVTVHYATAVGGGFSAKEKATANADYPAAAGTLTIPANTTSATIPIAVTGDVKLENNEKFLVNLSSPTNATLSMAQSGIVTIGNDELPQVVVKGKIASEGSNSVVTVTLKQSFWTVLNLGATTVGNTAASPGDFTAVNTTVTFPAGDTSAKTVSVVVKTDNLKEPVEAFFLQVSGGKAVVKGKAKIKANKT
jgi:parallel beta-helix repeat protein